MEKEIGITGAAGQIGTLLRANLEKKCLFRYYTQKPQSFQSTVVDLSQQNLVAGIFERLDTLIHLAAEPDPLAGWESVRKNNIEAMYNVMEECRKAGVRKVIFASTHHVQHGNTMGETPGTFDLNNEAMMKLSDETNPDSLYAVSKLFGEDLGKLYSERFGMSFIALRIGWVELDENPSKYLGTIHEDYLKAFFLSQNDCIRGFEHAIEKESPYLVAYLISNNPRHIFDLDETRRELGFSPIDSIDDFIGSYTGENNE